MRLEYSANTLNFLRVVAPRITGASATLIAGGWSMPCVLGASGMATIKREGDHATPVGTWPLRMLYYRADRLRRPLTGLRTLALFPGNGWCDAPRNPHYNRPVMLPFAASAETLWRDDGLYDLIIPLGTNDAPVRPAGGSAIFMHIARPDRAPTEGCVAISRKNFLRLLPQLGPRTWMVVG